MEFHNEFFSYFKYVKDNLKNTTLSFDETSGRQIYLIPGDLVQTNAEMMNYVRENLSSGALGKVAVDIGKGIKSAAKGIVSVAQKLTESQHNLVRIDQNVVRQKFGKYDRTFAGKGKCKKKCFKFKA